MSFYAFLNSENVVVEVREGRDASESLDGLTPEEWYGNFRQLKCLVTSPDAATDGFRKNFAQVGYSYDDITDAFYPPQALGNITI